MSTFAIDMAIYTVCSGMVCWGIAAIVAVIINRDW